MSAYELVEWVEGADLLLYGSLGSDEFRYVREESASESTGGIRVLSLRFWNQDMIQKEK